MEQTYSKTKLIIIRKAKIKDIHQIVLFALNLLKYHQNLDSYFSPVKNVGDLYNKLFRRCIHSKNRYLLVAEINNKIVGYALGETKLRSPVYNKRKIGFISDIFVDNNYRQRGIAKKFIMKFNIWFKDKKLEYVELTVHAKNNIANKTWEKYGFKNYLFMKKIKLGTK
ncbi:MAG: GNAT family N-acetyltransferase [Patescibacteria group bacterium]